MDSKTDINPAPVHRFVRRWPRVTFELWYVIVEVADVQLGVGWWYAGKRLALSWLHFTRTYYDGNWWSLRIGPVFICRGPY